MRVIDKVFQFGDALLRTLLLLDVVAICLLSAFLSVMAVTHRPVVDGLEFTHWQYFYPLLAVGLLTDSAIMAAVATKLCAKKTS